MDGLSRAWVRFTPVLMLISLACASSRPPAAPADNQAPPTEERDDNAEVLSSEAGAALLASDIQNPPAQPRVPANVPASQTLTPGLFKICVSSLGKVFGVEIVKSTGKAAVDHAFVSTIFTWRYRPYAKDGHPMHFCYPASVAASVRE